MRTIKIILEIALLNQQTVGYFDYLSPNNIDTKVLTVGQRVEVPFRRQTVIGIITAIKDHSNIAQGKLKQVVVLIDQKPVLSASIVTLCLWASQYYAYPQSGVLASALPRLLRLGKPAQFRLQKNWKLNPSQSHLNPQQQKLTIKQQQHIDLFKKHPQGITQNQLKILQLSPSILKTLLNKNWLTVTEHVGVDEIRPDIPQNPPLQLYPEQSDAVDQITNHLDHYRCFLLYGITGSGKTEIYLRCVSALLKRNQQALILVPEIGLTPQIIKRFQRRFLSTIAVLHSNRTDRQRLDAWLAASKGETSIVIGTRSSIFTPMPQLGMIIVDEEHDPSFKQQDGFHYSARDLAIMRAKQENIPIILGSATPSLESLYNVKQGRSHLLTLSRRTAKSKLSQFKMVDLRKNPPDEGLSLPLLKRMDKHLAQGNQVLLFLNRRGYAPVLICKNCAWIVPCKHCDSYLTLHLNKNYLLCHHCAYRQAMPKRCAHCQQEQLFPLGIGTERVEQLLNHRFPDIPILRIDKDSTRKKNSLANLLEQVQTGKAMILIGTQMLTKGHHFPHLTLVGILNADSGLYSHDFRATERLGQLLLQVSGRAGRENKPGEIIIQSYLPHHPLLKQLLTDGYSKFATSLLRERCAAKLPPYSSLVLVRSEAKDQIACFQFLEKIKQVILSHKSGLCQVLGPIPAPMARKAGYFQAQLLLQADRKKVIQRILYDLQQPLLPLFRTKKVRWTFDVDPIDLM